MKKQTGCASLRMSVMVLSTLGVWMLVGPVHAQMGDSDLDDDGLWDWEDNCSFIYNPGQEDGDGDGIGDVCEFEPDSADSDGDGIDKGSDNCPYTHNVEQTDCDSDGIGDACDSENATWVEPERARLCWIDVDDHVFEITLEFYGEQKLVDVSACGNPPQYKKVPVRGDRDCDRITGDPVVCCKQALHNLMSHGLRAVNDIPIPTMCDRHRNQNLCPNIR